MNIKLLSGGSTGKKGFCGGGGVPSSLTLFPWIKASDDNQRAYNKVCMSSSGQYQVINLANGFVYYSADYGNTWAQSGGAPAQIWTDICCSASGQIVYIMGGNPANGVYKSIDYGANFVLSINPGALANWTGIGCSGDGKYVIACNGGALAYLNWLSTDYGVTFNQFGPGAAAGASHAALSSDGQYQYVFKLGVVYKSSDYGVTWDAGTLLQAGTSNAIATDDTGKYILTYTGNLDVFRSDDFGVSYINVGFRLLNTGCCAMSRNGRIQVFSAQDINHGYLFISENYGQCFRAVGPPQNTWGLAVSDTGLYITRSTQASGIGWGYIYRKGY